MKKISELVSAALALFLICILYSSPVVAQSGVNSPYSRYGIGLLSDQSTGMTRSMGGLGAGFRNRNTLNLKNAASYSTVDTLTFIADLGFTLQNGYFNENGRKLNARNSYFSHIALQFRVLPKVGMTVGIMPFSAVGYAFSGTDLIRRDEDGEINSYNVYSGTGGVRQFMGGLGWRPTEWLSVGLNASYLTGDITHTVSNSYSSTAVQSRVKTYSADMSGLKLDFGVQGTIPFGDDRLVLGMTFTPAQKLETDAIVTDAHSVSDTTQIANAFALPEQFAAGFSYKRKNFMLGADFSYQTWSKARFFGEESGYDRFAAAAGFMITPDEDSKNLFKRMSYQVGVNYFQPYFKVGSSKGPAQYGVSAGFSIPITTSYNSMSYLHISGEYVRVQPMEKGMVTENYFRINLGVTFLERWFMKLMVE